MNKVKVKSVDFVGYIDQNLYKQLSTYSSIKFPKTFLQKKIIGNRIFSIFSFGYPKQMIKEIDELKRNQTKEINETLEKYRELILTNDLFSNSIVEIDLEKETGEKVRSAILMGEKYFELC